MPSQVYILAGRLRRFLISDALLHATQRQTLQEPRSSPLRRDQSPSHGGYGTDSGEFVSRANCAQSSRVISQFMTVRTRRLKCDG